MTNSSDSADSLTVTHMLRCEDETVAYYYSENKELVIYLDTCLGDVVTHFNVWGRAVSPDLPAFFADFYAHIVIHEILHAYGVKSSKQCEYVAMSLMWDKTIAEVVSSWLYPIENFVRIEYINVPTWREKLERLLQKIKKAITS